MLLRLLAFLLLATPALAQPDCQGRDLLAALTPAEKSALVGTIPYPSGNFWQATKGDSTITVAGTYHLNDPRFDALVADLAPYLAKADALLVEAGPAEEKQLKDAMLAHPETLIATTGPTLPEALSPEEWKKVSAALAAQGIPSVVAAKFQPWYVAMLLGMPVCHLTPDLLNGLDRRLMTKALAGGIPVKALEPWDTAMKAFDRMTPTDQMDMLRMALAEPGSPADLAITLSNAYVAGEHQLIWAWSRQLAVDAPGAGPEAAAQFAQMEATLVTGRTESWLPRILAAAAGSDVMVAVGAGHLGGTHGLLELLHEQGYTLTRLPF